MRFGDVFRRKEDANKLVDRIDKMIAELSKQSQLLKEHHRVCYEQAKRLAKEGISEAAKKWLAIALVCKKMRGQIESHIADLYASRIQVLATQPSEMPTLFETVNQRLERAERDRERAQAAMRQFGQLVGMRLEVAGGAEVYGVSSEELDEEFSRLQDEVAFEMTETMELPEIPVAAEAGVQLEEEKEKKEKAKAGPS